MYWYRLQIKWDFKKNPVKAVEAYRDVRRRDTHIF
jgi:hypothetical protein